MLWICEKLSDEIFGYEDINILNLLFHIPFSLFLLYDKQVMYFIHILLFLCKNNKFISFFQ